MRAKAHIMLARTPRNAGLPLEDDLVQDVMMRLNTDAVRERLDGKALPQLRKYALQTLHRRFVDVVVRKRSERLSTEGEPQEIRSEAIDPEQAAIAHDLQQKRLARVRAAVESLSDEERAFFVLSCAQGAPSAQRQVGWPPGSKSNACKWAARLLERVRQSLLADVEVSA